MEGRTSQKQGAEREKCTRSVKQQASVTECGLPSAKISSNECAACLGAYEDDIIDGVLEKEWIQCTNLDACGKWMHCSCLMRMGYIFALSVKSHFLNIPNDSHAR